MKRIFLFLILPLALTACQSQPQKGPSGQVKIGKPYIVDGKTYYPQYDESYDKIGEASWYGPGFHGQYTANGETFNQEDLTAAHPTLPMPSLVRVTNLTNGKSAILRVNDRGPFKSNRIIDLSRASADRLGIKGVQQVRVQFLKKESEEYLVSVQQGKPWDMFAYNNAPRSSQIIETTIVNSRNGQPISDAAPIVTVSSGDLTTPAGIRSQPLPPIQDNVPQPQTVTISNAWADDNVSLPTPEQPPQIADESPPPPTHSVKSVPSEKPTPDPSAGGNYLIQAGSFSSEENARKLSARISKRAKATVEEVAAAGKTWWRVRVGPFSAHEKAEMVLGDVRAAGAPDARIIRQ